MKKIISWFIGLKQTRKIFVVRIILALLLFIICWLLLTFLGKLLIDEKNTQKYLEEQNWLKFIKANIREPIINKYWKLLIVAVLSAASYKWFKGLASKIVRKYFVPKHKIDTQFLSYFPSLHHPEFLFLLPGLSYPCRVILKNNSENARINSVEIIPSIYKDVIVDHYNKEKMSQVFTLLHFEKGEDGDEPENDKGLKWNKSGANTFSIDTPFTLSEGNTIELPLIYPIAEEKDFAELADFIGDTALVMGYRITLSFDEDRFVKNIMAPLRILQWHEPEETQDNGGSVIIKGIEQISSKSKNSLDSYLQLDKEIHDEIEGGRRAAIQFANREILLEQIKEYKKLLEKEPRNAEICFELARALRDTMQYTEAMNFMNKAFALGLDTPDFHEERVNTGFLTGSFNEIKSSVERLLTLRPNDPESHVKMGTLLNIEEKNTEALTYINDALSLDPGFANAIYLKGRIMNEQEQYQIALELLNRAIQLEPDRREALVDQAYSLLRLGRADSALQSVKKALDLGFDDLEWLDKLGGVIEGNTKKKFEKLIAPLRNAE